MPTAAPSPSPLVRVIDAERLAPGTYAIRQLLEDPTEALSVYVNSAVIVGREPVLVDTGTAANREAWMEATFSLVDPVDVRWVFVSHDDADHAGNLHAVLEACPNATAVTTWLLGRRLAAGHGEAIDPRRVRWVDDGESFDAGDRTLLARLPPVFDNPTTRGLFDPTTGVYWAADAFATPVPHHVDDIDDLDLGFWREAFTATNRLLSPWHRFADPVRCAALVESTRRLGASTVASAHGVALRGPQIESALKLLDLLPEGASSCPPGAVDLVSALGRLEG